MRFLMFLLSIISALMLLIHASGSVPLQAQTAERPLILPMASDPGPNTWLFGQPYGNTVTAYNTGSRQYSAGQGLHFGLDFSMPCGTPLVAVADGVVTAVDNMAFGSAPHNLIIQHPDLNLASLYGHLLEPAPVTVGQQVRQGEIVAYSGDPDDTCVNRPHLHYELRSMDYGTTYNPVNWIDAEWHSLGIVGGFNYPLFQIDLYNTHRWLSLDDQPDVVFGGGVLNGYPLADTYPPNGSLRPAVNPPLRSQVTPFDASAGWRTRIIGFSKCCPVQWWDVQNPDRLWVLDGGVGQRALVYEWSADLGQIVQPGVDAPPAYTSPDSTRTIRVEGENAVIRTLSDGAAVSVFTGGVMPTLSTDNSKLLWTVSQPSPQNVPGARPLMTVYMADAVDRAEARAILTAEGASALWLDADRLLLSLPGVRPTTLLAVYDTRDGSQFTLGTFAGLRNLTVSPDGARVMFYTPYQQNPDDSAIYVLETQPGAVPQKIDWFGGWRWRDAESVYYIPFQWQDAVQTLHYYNVVTGEDVQLTTPDETPFGVMNAEWSVSPDGTRIVFRDVLTREMALLEAVGGG